MQNIKINVDFDKVCGKIKPMHAVNNMPTVPTDWGYGLFDKLREAGVQEGDTVSIYDFEFDFVY